MKVFLIILDGCPSYQINSENTPFLWGMKEKGRFFSDCKEDSREDYKNFFVSGHKTGFFFSWPTGFPPGKSHPPDC